MSEKIFKVKSLSIHRRNKIVNFDGVDVAFNGICVAEVDENTMYTLLDMEGQFELVEGEVAAAAEKKEVKDAIISNLEAEKVGFAKIIAEKDERIKQLEDEVVTLTRQLEYKAKEEAGKIDTDLKKNLESKTIDQLKTIIGEYNLPEAEWGSLKTKAEFVSYLLAKTSK